MSFSGVVDACARVVAGAGVLESGAVYSSTSGSSSAVINMIPLDLGITPAAIVRLGGFSLTPGSFERIHHNVNVDLYFDAADPGLAERQMYPTIDGVVAAFRANVDVLHEAGVMQAIVRGGDPPVPEDYNGKPVIRLTVNIDVLEATVRTYSLSP